MAQKLALSLPSMLVFCIGSASAQETEGPWGTVHGSLAGTSSTAAIPYRWASGPMAVAWKIDVRAAGYDRVSARGPITFDRDGNLYWKTSTGGKTGGVARVVSASPAGSIRWVGKDAQGAMHGLGGFFDGTAVVVGADAVYALGGRGAETAGALVVAAYGKATGVLLWEAELVGSIAAASGPDPSSLLLTPVLHGGKIYVLAPNAASLLPQNVYQVNAADGALDWSIALGDIAVRMGGAMTFVADAFGPGAHGLYANGDSGAAADGVPDVFGIKVMATGAEIAWSAEGGAVERSHLIYSAATGALSAATGAAYGGTLYTYDAAAGALLANANERNAGHGNYDVACLDFNGSDIIAGASEGLVIRYRHVEAGGGKTESAIAFNDEDLAPKFWGDYRTYGQLLRAPNGNSILITGTNSDTRSDPAYSARVVAIDVTEGRLLWEFDTGVVQNDGFTLRGGPCAGPDGKIYYFDAITGELVALRGASGAAGAFKRGDANASGRRDIADAVAILSFLFGAAGISLPCKDAADANNDGSLNIADAVKLLGHLFGNQGPLPEPFGSCGEDQGPGAPLGCDSFMPCVAGGG